MGEPLRISSLDKVDTEDFEQLKVLLKKFIIDTYIRNKPEFGELRGRKKAELVKRAIDEFDGKNGHSVLSSDDIKHIEEDIKAQIDIAQKSIENSRDNGIENRQYILKDGNKVVAFQQAQIINNQQKSRIEGWRNLAYIEQEYAGKMGEVIDSKGVVQEGIYTDILYEDIGKWFEENEVGYERITTGVNMLPNILAYIRAKGFLPYNKNGKSIFMEKIKGRDIDKQVLSKAYKMYCENRDRTDPKNKNEILGEIASIEEFEGLTEEQKIGLAKCFLKEEEKDLEIPNDKMQVINNCIHENLVNRRKSTDYNMLHQISEMIIKNLKIKDRNTNEKYPPIAEEKTKEVVLDFFKSLDEEWYERAKSIISGNSDMEFNMYQDSPNLDFSKTNSDGLPLYSRGPCVITRNGKNAMYIPCKGDLRDVCTLVHEISHTFDLMERDNPTRNMLGEITPYCFESMLDQYLVENKIATKEDVANHKKHNLITSYNNAVETFTKLELMKIKEKNGEIKSEDITNLQKKYNVPDKQLEFILTRLVKSEPSVDYRARYMIAELAQSHYMETYEKNPEKAIGNLKTYFGKVKENDFRGSLEALGIEPTIDSVEQLIDFSNRKMGNKGKEITRKDIEHIAKDDKVVALKQWAMGNFRKLQEKLISKDKDKTEKE